MIWNLFGNRKIQEYQKRVGRDPNDAAAHFHLGVEYERRGESKKALGAFEEVVRLNPRSAEAHFNLALLHERLNDGRNAIKHIAQAGNLFSEKNKPEQKALARKLLHEYHDRFKIPPEDLKAHDP